VAGFGNGAYHSRSWQPFGAEDGASTVIENVAWTLQVLALVIVGTSLLVGIVYDQIRVELGMLGIGAAIFLFARWLEARSRR
jgi:hypothetical protein